MAGSFDSEGESISDINITPFVDVVLVLLVIFMVTAPMMVQKVLDVQLPNSESSDTTQPDTLAVAVTSNGQFLINGNITTDNGLLDQASKAVERNKNVQVIIAADMESAHKFVIKAIDLIKRAGVENFAFQVTRTTEEIQ